MQAEHPRTRERFLALYLIASGAHNATTWAAHFGRQDETVLGWVHRYNARGPDALAYRRTGGPPPLLHRPGPAARRGRHRHRAGRPRPARPRLDAEEAPAVGLGHLRPHRGTQRDPPDLAAAKLTWKKIKKLLGKAKAPKRAGTSPGSRAVRRRLSRRGHADLHRRVALPPRPGPGLHLGPGGSGSGG